MATYGEGDPTDNAHELYEWLQNDQDLEGVNYAVSLHGLFVHVGVQCNVCKSLKNSMCTVLYMVI